MVNRIFKFDSHVHTYHSPCAKDKINSHPGRMLAQAESLGIDAIAFTDHFAQHAPYIHPVFEGCGPVMIEQLRREVMLSSSRIRVLFGCEADVVNLHSLSIEADYSRHLDFTMLCASHFHLPGVQQPECLEARCVAEHYMAFLRKALEQNFISVIAHPFYTPGYNLGSPNVFMPEIRDEEFHEIAVLAREKKIAMEVNGHLRWDSEYLRAIKKFFDICRKAGVRFTYGSDAHHSAGLKPTQAMEDAIRFLDLTPNHFLSPDELLNNSKSI